MLTAVSIQSFASFTCKLWMMRGGTLLIFVTGSKVNVIVCTRCIKPWGHDTDYSFCQITFKLLMMRKGTLSILSHLVKGQGQLWDSAYKTLFAQYRLQLLLDYFQIPYISCWWWEERELDIFILGLVVVNLGLLRWDATLYVVWPIKSRSNMTGNLCFGSLDTKPLMCGFLMLTRESGVFATSSDWVS